jgi:hypothetical protein
MKLEFSRQIFEKSSSITFHQNPSSGSRVVPCRQMDTTKLIVAFRNFANVPNETANLIYRSFQKHENDFVYNFLDFFPPEFLRSSLRASSHFNCDFACCYTRILNLFSYFKRRTHAESFRQRVCWGKYLDLTWRRKICPGVTLFTTDPTWTGLGWNVCGICGEQNRTITGVSPSIIRFSPVNIIQPVPHTRI